jgi:hypothetical protein
MTGVDPAAACDIDLSVSPDQLVALFAQVPPKSDFTR